MRIAIERRVTPPATHLIEIVTPRTNGATLGAAENLLAAISLAEPFALEIAATAEARRFLARAGDASMARHLADQLGVAYPQATLRGVAADADDPARRASDEVAAACALVLRAPPYLPLRPFVDLDLDGARAAQADPVLGILGALGGLPPGWRALCQLVLAPAPDDWARPYLSLATERPRVPESSAGGGAGATMLLPVVVAGTGIAAWQGYAWYAAADWLRLFALAGGLTVGIPGLAWAARGLRGRPDPDPRLVAEKLSRPAYRAELRLTVLAPAGTPPTGVAGRLGQLAAAYRQFALATGNGFLARRLDLAGRDLRALAPLAPARRRPLLTTRELAALWHPPHAGADAPLVERTTARRRLPPARAVAAGCPIGRAAQQGAAIPVALPPDLTRRHLLAVAKTRRGKSSLLLAIIRCLIADSACVAGGRPPLVFVVDPHQDLYRATLGLVPPARREDVVALDLADAARPFGLNLLDVGLGWGRDEAVANALTVFRREFDRFWGPRMADAFRFALLTLYEANAALCATDPTGRRRQHTVLEVPALLTEEGFRREVLTLVTDPVIHAWWSGYFAPLDRRAQLDIVNPVLTKVNTYAGTWAARAVVGQPRSTIDPAAWLRDGAIVAVNTAKGTVGAETAALVGSTLINLVGLAVAAQAGLPAEERRAVTIIVDELHTMPGADYESILSELAKYGANLILATQSLGRLDALDRPGERALKATIFANLDGLFAFHTSAEDARYLVPELGGEAALDVADLTELGEYQCYAKLSTGGERVPAFLVQLDPPPVGDPVLAATLAAASSARYGRGRSAVEDDIRAALERIARTRPKPRAGREGDGVAHDTTADEQGKSGGKRNKHRPPKQGTLPEPAASGAAEAADAVDPGSGASDEAGDEDTGDRDGGRGDEDTRGEGVRP
jgi:hypothetical protein